MAAVIMRFAEIHHMAERMLWGDMKIASFAPADAATSVRLSVRGDHAFFVSGPQTKGVIAKMKTTKPRLRPSVVLRVLMKNADPPAAEWNEWSGEAEPGHYFSDDLGRVRLELHAKGFCPLVQISGRSGFGHNQNPIPTHNVT